MAENIGRVLRKHLSMPLIIIVIIGGLFLSFKAYRAAYQSGLESLKSRTDTIAATIDQYSILALSGDETDLYNEAYVYLKDKMYSISLANPDVRFVYIMGMRDGEMFFYVDSENPESEDYSAPGDIYSDESPALTDAFLNSISSTEGPISDSWGTWISGISPIKSDDGSVIAAVGMDVDAEAYESAAWSDATQYLLIVFAITLLLIIENIARRKEDKILALKSQFVAIASHEIRAPMNGIIWSIGTIRDDPHSPTHIKSLADDMRAHATNLLETTNNILSAYATDTKSELFKEKVQLKSTVAKAVDFFSLTAKKKGQLVDVGAIPDDATIHVNSGQVNRVFSNIISNAIKYSPEGSVITVRYDDADGMHNISVKDSGIGIPESEISKITSGFYRASNATETSVEGSGLGLYLVKKIVDMNGGGLKIESRIGQGTTVRVSFKKMV